MLLLPLKNDIKKLQHNVVFISNNSGKSEIDLSHQYFGKIHKCLQAHENGKDCSLFQWYYSIVFSFVHESWNDAVFMININDTFYE